MFGVVVKSSYYQAGYDPGDPSDRVEYDKFVQFDSKQHLERWLLENNEKGYNKATVVKVFELKEIKPVFTVNLAFD